VPQMRSQRRLVQFMARRILVEETQPSTWHCSSSGSSSSMAAIISGKAIISGTKELAAIISGIIEPERSCL